MTALRCKPRLLAAMKAAPSAHCKPHMLQELAKAMLQCGAKGEQ
jgi:hypothetical protein